MKTLRKYFALLITGPLVGFYIFFSKHWLINSLIALSTATTLMMLLPVSLPVLVCSFLAGYAASAATLGVVQQITAFFYNWRLNQCEMMVAPIVPEISYAAYKGILHANTKIAEVEDYQKHPESFYGRKAADFLLASAGHFSCRGRCMPITWEMKEEANTENSCCI
ncbi:Uncharacterised protein [Legionella lansingensis]|uniref:Transmembrane protein n=1 Tax=Legionella lansingensis TaxID=45067 RepID=A0A0W0VFC1_9GAMM|nr:hypothetical protein [Legionella lansingensis]KTD18816.1 hypothetical protein Llan_2419 [Legionella lansingensis]SNV43324.1 Uncharacterised protein [Legionella lansingensis]